MSLEGRYLDRAQRVAERFGQLHPKEQELLADDIVLLLREFVHHDMEWAALAVERLRQDSEVEAGHEPCDNLDELTSLAASFRARGCEP